MELPCDDDPETALAEKLRLQPNLLPVDEPMLLATEADKRLQTRAAAAVFFVFLEGSARRRGFGARSHFALVGGYVPHPPVFQLGETELRGGSQLLFLDDLAKRLPLVVFDRPAADDRADREGLKEQEGAPRVVLVRPLHTVCQNEVQDPGVDLQRTEADPPDGQGQVANHHEDGEHEHWPRVRKTPNTAINLMRPVGNRVDAEGLGRVPGVDKELQRGDEEYCDDDKDLPHGRLDFPPDRRNLCADYDHDGDGGTRNGCTAVQPPDQRGC
mmetsp:Transcript_84568/g.266959  ORF Transcript_84568/g.266959 Transcript_84568/m.266959 type:complete len:271 (+) Transcript_84568:798-1610(+)